MKILHTADWHLGKRLNHFSRIAEQKLILDEICDIAERESVDAVLVAGDLFDHANPSTEAIELLYKCLKRLSNEGKRPVIGIAGNHDSPDRIEAPDPLARECGIIFAGYPNSQVQPFALESGLAVIRSEPGFIELNVPGCENPLRILLTPYANSFRLKKYLGTDDPEEALRMVLEQNWKRLSDKYCDKKGINLLMTHLFVMKKGGQKPEESEDEKTILTVGGAQEIYSENFPEGIQYVALGHLHRQQTIAHSPCPIVYSGSPLCYSMSEAGQEKFAVLVEAEPGAPVSYQNIPLKSGKSLHRKSFDHIDEAVNWLVQNPNCLVELTLVSDNFLNTEERKRLYDAHDGIVTLIPRITNPELVSNQLSDMDLSRDIQELFVDYFKHRQGQNPNEDLLNLFKEVLGEEEDSN